MMRPSAAWARAAAIAPSRPALSLSGRRKSFYPGWNRYTGEAFAPEHRPDGDIQQGHGRERGFDTLRQPEPFGRGGEDHRALAGSSQQAPRIGQVPCTPGPIRVKKGPLDSDQRATFADGGEKGWTKCKLRGFAEWRPWMIAQRSCRGRESAFHQIGFGRGVRDRTSLSPQIARPCPEPAVMISPPIRFLVWRRRQGIDRLRAKAAELAKDIKDVATREAFEQQAGMPHPNRKAWASIGMGRTKAHASVVTPASFQTVHKRGPDGSENWQRPLV